MNNLTLNDRYAYIKEALLKAEGKDPVKILHEVASNDFVFIHGPEHHFLDGGAFLAALHNAGMEFDLGAYLDALAERTMKMPGAMCGYWGVCGSVASLGAAFSLLEKTGPLSVDEAYADHLDFTSSCLARMAKIGGPRCCKRNAFLVLEEAIRHVKKRFGISLDRQVPIVCDFFPRNRECKKEQCPFYPRGME